MPTWISSPVFALLALIFFIGAAAQTVRIDGVPLFYTGMRTQLAECRVATDKANAAALVAVEKTRVEGAAQAAADTTRLQQEAAAREKGLQQQLTDINKIVANLRARPPIRVTTQAPGPVVMLPQPLPPLPAVCMLEPTALDNLRSNLNMGRMP